MGVSTDSYKGVATRFWHVKSGAKAYFQPTNVYITVTMFSSFDKLFDQ